MGLEFLTRVRRATIWLGATTALLVATYRGPAQGLAVALGAAWSLANLFLLEKLIVAVISPDRETPSALRRAVLSIAGFILLFAAGAVLLLKLSPIGLVGGFSIPLAVIVFKAVALSLLPSRLWRRFTASRWSGAAAVAVFVLGAWLASAGWTPNAPVTTGRSQRGVAQVQAPGTAPQGQPPSGDPHSTVEPSTHGAEGESATHGEGHEAKSEGPEKFPNFITVLVRANPDAPWAHFLHRFEAIIFSLLIALLLCVVAFLASRNPQMIPGRLQNVVELLVETLRDFVVGILGPDHGRRYLPFLGTLFIYILAMNLFGLIPFMDSPTSSLNVTVALALVVFLFSQFIGFRELGVVGYFDHLMGNPRSAIGWFLVPLMLPIHVMGELAKPISLSCRLFGNIFGEDMLLVAFASLGVMISSLVHIPVGVPLQLPFMFLALLTSTLQALVFTVLSTIYILLMLPHDEHAHEAEVQHAH
jgi:F-type H+-transporting ATPase subunit a